MHGGAKGVGPPKGERNGAYRPGMRTAEMIELRREANDIMRWSRAMLRSGID